MEAPQSPMRSGVDESELVRCLFEDSSDVILIVDSSFSQILDSNRAARRVTGLAREQLLKQPLSGILSRESQDRVPDSLAALRSGRNDESNSLRLKTADSHWLDVSVSVRDIELAGESVILLVARDISEQTRAEQQLREVAAGTATVTGDEFYATLVRHLCLALEVQYAVVVELTGAHHENLKSLAACCDARPVEPFQFPLEGTPCSRAVRDGEYFCDRGLLEAFPDCEVVQQLQAESYLGIAIRDSSGQVFGNLCVLNSQPFSDDDAQRSLLRVFAARAGAEMERQRTELELQRGRAIVQESIARSHAVLDSLAASIAILDADGAIVAVNETWRRFGEFNGLSTSDYAVGTNYLQACEVPDSSGGTAADGIRAVLDGRQSEFYLEYDCHSPQEQRWFAMRVNPVKGHVRRHVVVAHEDITRRRRAEESMRLVVEGTAEATGEQFHQSLVRHLAEAIGSRYVVLVDLPDDNPTNARTLSVWAGDDYAPNFEYELRGTPCETVVEQSAFCIFGSGIQALFPDDTLLHDMGIEAYVGIPLLGSTGNVVGLLVALHDSELHDSDEVRDLLRIFSRRAATELERGRAEHELKQSREELQQAHERLDLAITGTSDGLWDWDMNSGAVWISPHGRELLGHESEEHNGDAEMWRQLVHPDDLPYVEQAIERHLVEGHPYDVEIRLLTSSGEYRWFCSRGSAIRNADGIPVRMCGSLRDVTERRLVNEQLEASRAESVRLRTQLVEAIESISEGFALYDADDRLVMCNNRYREIYDQSADLLVTGVSFEDYIRASVDRGQIAEAVGREDEWVRQRLIEHSNPGESSERQLGNGRWVEVTERRTREGGTVGVRTDVTERKLAEEALRNSEQMYRSLFEESQRFREMIDQAGEAIFVVDPATAVFIDANTTAIRNLGYTRDELLKLRVFNIQAAAPVNSAANFVRFVEKMRSYRVMSIKGAHKRKDGSTFPVDVTVSHRELGGREYLVAIARDVTKQRQAEQSLKESEERLRTLLENHIDGVLVIANDQIRYVNDPMCSLCGRKRDELLQTPFEDLLKPDTQSDSSILRAGKAWVAEHELIHEQGHTIPVEIVTRAIRFEGENGFLTVARDISWRRKLEDEARRHRELLARANRVSTLGEMATGLAHELNQPLAAIAMYSKACVTKLQAASDDTLGITPIMEGLSEQAFRAGSIVDRIRKFVGKEEFVQCACSIGDLIDDVLAFLDAELADHEVEVETQIDDGLPQVFADRVQIEQVLVNLIHNSVDAMKDCDRTVRRLRLSADQRDAGFVEVTVQDFGPGMPQHDAAKVFDAFYSTKADGMGMGLAICRTIVEAHGGRIHIVSQAGEGASCSFTLPACKEEHVHAD